MSYFVTKIKEGLYQISSPLGVRYVHQYLFVEDESAVLIDVGMAETPEKVIIPALREIGVALDQVKTIVISHADVDHFAGAANIKSYISHATLMAHKLDTPWIESKQKIMNERYFYYEKYGVYHDEATKQWFRNGLVEANVDVQLVGGETLHLGSDRYIDIIHTPGHTEGHLSFYDRKNHTAVILDAVLWKGLYDREKVVVSPPPYYSISNYLESIEKILKLDIDILLTGHYDVLKKEEVVLFLEESKSFVNKVENTVYEILNNTNRPLSLKEVLEQTNERVGNFSEMMVELVGPVYAHLLELESHQKISRLVKDSKPYWEGKSRKDVGTYV